MEGFMIKTGFYNKWVPAAIGVLFYQYTAPIGFQTDVSRAQSLKFAAQGDRAGG